MASRRNLGFVYLSVQTFPSTFERFGWILHAIFVAVVIYCLSR